MRNECCGKGFAATEFGVKFRRQHPFGPFILDFVCLEKRVVVEVDGSQHQERVIEDAERTRYLEDAGFRVIRFWNNEIFNQMGGVIEAIYAALNPSHPTSLNLIPAPTSRTHPHPNPPLEGEGETGTKIEQQETKP